MTVRLKVRFTEIRQVVGTTEELHFDVVQPNEGEITDDASLAGGVLEGGVTIRCDSADTKLEFGTPGTFHYVDISPVGDPEELDEDEGEDDSAVSRVVEPTSGTVQP